MEDTIESLENQRKKCENDFNYVEAEMLKNRIHEMRMSDFQKSFDNMTLKQQ